MIGVLATRLMRLLPGEAAHRLTIRGLAMTNVVGATPSLAPANTMLHTTVAGLSFPNPLGLAAGFDKDAEVIAPCLGLGFGFVEVGTITPKAQPGNPKPRVFRLPVDGGVINRYGFNNQGMAAAAARLEKYSNNIQAGIPIKGIVGVNIGANKDSEDWADDYFRGAEHLAQYADYITINISSPNTKGLRGLQEPELLRHVLKAAKDGMSAANAVRPLMLKIAPDLDHEGLTAVLDVALDEGCAAIIIANTTISRPEHLQHPSKNEIGGLSGRPLFQLSNRVLYDASQYLKSIEADTRLPIIAAGGVDGAKAAYLKLLLGASLVQIYTGIVHKGPTLPGEILAGLVSLLKRDNIKNIDELKALSLSFEAAEDRAYR